MKRSNVTEFKKFAAWLTNNPELQYKLYTAATLTSTPDIYGTMMSFDRAPFGNLYCFQQLESSPYTKSCKFPFFNPLDVTLVRSIPHNKRIDTFDAIAHSLINKKNRKFMTIPLLNYPLSFDFHNTHPISVMFENSIIYSEKINSIVRLNKPSGYTVSFKSNGYDIDPIYLMSDFWIGYLSNRKIMIGYDGSPLQMIKYPLDTILEILNNHEVLNPTICIDYIDEVKGGILNE